MSNHLAIATVTAALRQTLQEVVPVDVTGAEVSTKRPDKVTAPTAVNIYLYQVTPNAAWCNADLPTRGNDGKPRGRSRVALDLHYLLTFHGNEGEFEPERLLGSVVRRLRERPVLARGLIESTVADQTRHLAGSDLAEETEMVKFTPGVLSIEELSKLWSVFFQTPYVLSMAYTGTVVLIDGVETPAPALPVRARHLEVVPFRRPTIETVVPEDGAEQPILATSRLRIRGRRLRGDRIRVRIGGAELAPRHEGETEIVVALDDLPDAVLRAGVQPVQVVHFREPGARSRPRLAAESNALAIVLRPSVASVSVSKRPTGEPPDKKRLERVIAVEIRPQVGKDQRVALLLRELAEAEPKAYTFFARPRHEDGDTIEVTVDAEAGEYLVAVQVDGAESPLEIDTDHRYIGPKVSIQ